MIFVVDCYVLILLLGVVVFIWLLSGWVCCWLRWMGSVTRLVGLLFSVICLLVWCLALVCLGLLLDLLYLWLWCFTGGGAGIGVACFC